MIRIVAYIMGGSIPNDKQVLFRTDQMDDYPILSAKVSLEVNKAGTFNFEISHAHSLASKIYPFRNFVLVEEEYCNKYAHPDEWVSDKQNILFYGRVLMVDTDLYGNKNVECEGSLSFLNDSASKVNDYGFSGSYDFINFSISYGYNNVIDLYGPTDRFKYFRLDYDVEDVTIDKDLTTDGSHMQIGEMINSYILSDLGGFIVCRYDPYYSDLDGEGIRSQISDVETLFSYMKWDDNFGSGIGGNNPLMPYYEYEESHVYSDTRYDFLPVFQIGKNILQVSKEPAIEEVFTGVYPVGKNGLTLQNEAAGGTNEDRFIWKSSAVNKYGRIVKIINYSDISTRTTLRSYAKNWLNRHSADGLDTEYKYTVTGPEPLEFGMGNVFIQLMRDIIYIPTKDGTPEYGLSYPCLSMEIDCLNAANNTYTFGPYVSDNYTQTNLSKSKN